MKRGLKGGLPGIHSIQIKILAICLMIAMGTTVISLIISYYAEVHTIKKTTEMYMTQYISFADRNFKNMLEEAEKISLSAIMEQEVILPDIEGQQTEASYEDYKRKKRVRSFLSGLISQKEYINNMLLITLDKQIFQSNTDLIMKKDLLAPIMQRALSKETSGIVSDRDAGVVPFCRPVISSGKKVGVNIVELDYDSLTAVWQTEPLQSVNIYIYEADGELFYTNDLENGEEKALYQQIISSDDSTGYLNWNGEKQYFIRYDAQKGGMVTVSLMPYKTLLQDTNNLGWHFFMIGAIAVLFAVITSVYFSRRLCTNLYRLTENMEEVRKGNLSVRSEICSKDEVGILSGTFNDMVERISDLLDEVRQKEKLKREAEQSVLATQIEPHFLYNSVDSIQYVAHMRGETEIENVANALSELLRSVLSNRNEWITLWEEREYIENYVTIERFKYREEFQLVWEVDEALWTWKIPKLLLQPVVENAVIHGVSTRESGGMIQIQIRQQKQKIYIKIIDNGKGMSQEKIEILLSQVKRTDKSGFRRVGFANVLNRIALIYGEEYGGTIYSCEGVFTCVELTLPAQEKAHG